MTTTTSVPDAAAPTSNARRTLATLGPFLGLIAVIAVFALLTDSPSQYLSVRNFRIVVAQTVIVALGAIANNISRATVFRAHIDRGKAVTGAAMALPGAALAELSSLWSYRAG